jgi:hypothetical protein
MGGQVRRLASRDDRVDYVRRQEGERQQAADVAIADFFERRELGDTTDLSRDQRLKTAMSNVGGKLARLKETTRLGASVTNRQCAIAERHRPTSCRPTLQLAPCGIGPVGAGQP